MNKTILKIFEKKIYLAFFCALFVSLIVGRFIFPETKSVFGFDQVDNAWAVKNIIINGDLPLTGMQAKGNTGFFIGPYYYYYLVPFYFLTGMDPIASPIIALVTAVISFFITFYAVRSLFNIKMALIALFITVFSSYILILDRVQWPVNFIVPVSFLVFLSLFKICSGKPKYLLLLAGSVGFSLHIHFTSIFYFLIILLSVPLFPRTKQTLKYLALSLPIFAVFIFPIALNYYLSQQVQTATSYLGSTFHGFHLRRVLQLTKDATIEFNGILGTPYSMYVSIVSILLSAFLLFRAKKMKKKFLLMYLAALWIAVPWIAFSTYSGELTNYYFALTRPIALIVFSYLIYRILESKRIIIIILVALVGIYYLVFNFMYFLSQGPVSLSKQRKETLEKVNRGERIEFTQGNPQSYLYYYYVQLKGEGK